MSDERELLRRTAEIAAQFIDTLDERPVFPLTPVEELGARLGGPLPDTPTDPRVEGPQDRLRSSGRG